MSEPEIPFYTQDSEEIVRILANKHLQQLRMYNDEDEEVLIYNGEELTAKMVDRAITQHFKDN
jgi:hypothetical protein